MPRRRALVVLAGAIAAAAGWRPSSARGQNCAPGEGDCGPSSYGGDICCPTYAPQCCQRPLFPDNPFCCTADATCCNASNGSAGGCCTSGQTCCISPDGSF